MNIQTKIASIIIFFCLWKTGFCQLSLETIFLSDKYAVKNADAIQFLHTKPLFAKFIRTNDENYIAFYNEQNIQTAKWNLSKESLRYNFRNLTLSNKDQYFLLGAACDPLYRYSFFCNYYYGDSSGKLIPLSNDKQIYPAFSPDDKKIAFIKKNNLFYKNISSETEIQITTDGEWNKVINGKSDWVYEEEFKLTRAYEWNCKNDKIAYLKFDESQVKEFSIPLYYDLQYPNYFRYKYPKVGEENAKVSVWLYDVKSKKNKQIILPFSYEYIPRIYWNATGDEVIAMLLNRHQDTLKLVSYDIKTKKTRQLYIETDKKYIDLPILQFISDNSFFISSEKNGYNHIYHYDKNGKLLNQITNGKFEIKDVYGIDENNKLIYYQSNEEKSSNSSTNRNLYQINYETLDKKLLYNTTEGSTKAAFSTDYSFYIRTFSSITTPPITHLISTKNNNIVLLENNQFLKDSLVPLLPKKNIQPFNLFTKDRTINSYHIYRNDSVLNPASTIAQPILFFVYGGPGNEEVINEWNSKNSHLFLYYLAQQGIQVICIDPIGSSGQGAEFKKSTYLNLGKYETEDILDCARKLKADKKKDSLRLGIFGWSYGGYLAANCLMQGNAIFKAGIAAAPVSNWNLYSSAYTERYMRTPKENPLGYYTSNLIPKAKMLNGNLLLIHGTADENVHFQHSIHLINALNEANKSYQLYLNPDSEHGTLSKKNRYNLYEMIFEFLIEKL